LEPPAAKRVQRYITNVSDSSEQALVEAARAGDRAALEQLLENVQSRIYSFGMKMCGDREDAREVVQDTLLAVARSLRDFRGESSLSTWLYTIARSFCIKRRRHPRPEEPLDFEAADPAADPEKAATEQQIERLLLAAMGELEPMYREVLILRDGEGLTAPEAAQVLGISVDAVKSRLHRARVQVRDRLMSRLGAPPDSGCHDVATLWSRKLEGEISADVCAEMERHLEGCERCRAQCESLQRTLKLCRRCESGPVPADVQESVRASVRRFLGDLP
jgi:RNA polymerase sigma-70 factor (ECF subfamily)